MKFCPGSIISLDPPLDAGYRSSVSAMQFYAYAQPKIRYT
jgi:hypothetical protein